MLCRICIQMPLPPFQQCTVMMDRTREATNLLPFPFALELSCNGSTKDARTPLQTRSTATFAMHVDCSIALSGGFLLCTCVMVLIPVIPLLLALRTCTRNSVFNSSVRRSSNQRLRRRQSTVTTGRDTSSSRDARPLRRSRPYWVGSIHSTSEDCGWMEPVPSSLSRSHTPRSLRLDPESSTSGEYRSLPARSRSGSDLSRISRQE